MSKFKAILIDDEPLALQRLEKLLKPYGDVIQILSKVSSGMDAVREIDKLHPDVIFLDIQMPELNGFEVLERINHHPFVIFSTAYDEYALRAFESNSIDYLLKPITATRLEKALDKLKNITGNSVEGFQLQIQELLQNVKKTSFRIQVKKGDKIKLLDQGNITHFTADEKYTRVSTFSESFLIDKSLTTLEDLLEDCFVRIHRKAIVNINHVDEIVRMFKGNFKVVMKDELKSELPLSRTYKHNLGL